MSVAIGAEPNLFFINAWNEWNEQAVLEPSTDLSGFGFLAQLSDALSQVGFDFVRPLSDVEAGAARAACSACS